MVDFDVDVEGLENLQETLDDVKDNLDDEPIYVVGSSVEYGVYLEFGRSGFSVDEDTAIPIETEDGTIFRQSVGPMPPYPWFRPAVREFKRDPEGFIRSNTDFDSIDAIPDVESLVKAIAFGLESQMRRNVSANTSGDRSRGTDPEHPQRDTGTLVNSIQAVRIN